MPPPTTAADLQQVCHWVTTQCRPNAGDALRTGMETVDILQPLEMDTPGLLAALLQPLLPINKKEQTLLTNQFGQQTLDLLQRASQMRQLSALSQHHGSKTNPRVNEENLRKMLIAMVDDIRVVLIELARHLAALRRSKRADAPVQAALGRLTLEVYAPLANRLGVRQMKWQMEDHALRCLHPDEYHRLAATLDEKRAVRETYISEFIRAVRAALAESALACEVEGRPKHLFSIWKKMRRKDLAFENLRDIRALRIVVDSVADCYSALAVVHTHWHGLPAEFADYIATPKANGYRSIHTVVIGPREQTVEVQIRTREMHRQSEWGVAAHWRYKENVRADDSIDNKVLRLRQLLEWKDELRDAGALAETIGRADDEESDAPDERVYVFTPQGMVIDLPHGATPIDFAYAIHTQVGHCTRGARVNGKMVTLIHRLETGEQVHIHTAKGGQPSRDWLRKDLGYVCTRRARNRIALWFKRADYAQHLAEGRNLLERELSRLGMDDLSYEKIARATPFHKTDDLLAALGANDFKLSRALAPFRNAAQAGEGAQQPATLPPKPRRIHKPKPPTDFSVSGVGNLLTRMANCCNPIPGDPITGFITTGRGISIHRQDCANLHNLTEPRRSRLVEVQWGKSNLTAWPVDIKIAAYPRHGLLNDITQLFKEEKIEVVKLNMETDADNNASIRVRLEISGLKKLSRVLHRLSTIPDVLQARRVEL